MRLIIVLFILFIWNGPSVNSSDIHYDYKPEKWERVLIELDLEKIFPSIKTNWTKIELTSNQTNREIEYYPLKFNGKIYFLSSFNDPTNLTINYNFKINNDDSENLRTVTINYKVKAPVSSKKSFYIFEIDNWTLGQLIEKERILIDAFRRVLALTSGKDIQYSNIASNITSIKRIERSSEGETNKSFQFTIIAFPLLSKDTLKSLGSEDMRNYIDRVRSLVGLNMKYISSHKGSISNEGGDYLVNLDYSINYSNGKKNWELIDLILIGITVLLSIGLFGTCFALFIINQNKDTSIDTSMDISIDTN